MTTFSLNTLPSPSPEVRTSVHESGRGPSVGVSSPQALSHMAVNSGLSLLGGMGGTRCPPPPVCAGGHAGQATPAAGTLRAAPWSSVHWQSCSSSARVCLLGAALRGSLGSCSWGPLPQPVLHPGCLEQCFCLHLLPRVAAVFPSWCVRVAAPQSALVTFELASPSQSYCDLFPGHLWLSGWRL